MTVNHVVVDGSNLATEGRTLPSLSQLDDAVRAFMGEFSPKAVTVVVDATFPNRIDASRARGVRRGRRSRRDHHAAGGCDRSRRRVHPAGRRPRERRRAVERLVPGVPRSVHVALRGGSAHRRQARAVRRLGVHAALTGARPDEPSCGERRQEGGQARRAGVGDRRAERRARPGGRRAKKAPAKAAPAGRAKKQAAAGQRQAPSPAKAAALATAPAEGGRSPPPWSWRRWRWWHRRWWRQRRSVSPYNDALPFIEFVGAHPVGSVVQGEVERFASHGAYVTVDGTRCYLPLKHLADPPPRSAARGPQLRFPLRVRGPCVRHPSPGRRPDHARCRASWHGK